MKYKIGIVPNADDDAACLLAIASLEEPMMTDLFIPVLYAGKERIERLRNGRESDTKFVFMADAESLREDCVCVVNADNVAEGQTDGAAQPVVPVWQRDLQNGLLDALVYEGDVDVQTCIVNAHRVVYISETANMALLGRENVADNLASVLGLLERDLDMARPRVAVVADTDKQKEEWEEKAAELHAFLYGPFLTETFFEEEQFMNYDAILAVDFHSAITCFREAAHAWGVCMTEDSEGRLTFYPAYNTQPMGEDAEAFNTNSFNRSIYSALDVLRSRERYDEAHRSPLPKLYHEKREDRRGGNIE